MVEKQLSNPENISSEELTELERHKYPIWLSFFGLFILIIFLYTITRFIWSDLFHHHKIGKQIEVAENHFKNKEYDKAIRLYMPIVQIYSNYKKGNIRIAESCFASISSNEDLYDIGLSYLSDSYTDTEIKEIKSFLPKKYKSHFEQQFKKR